MKKYKRYGVILTAICILAFHMPAVRAEESWPAPPEILGEAAIVMEANTGAVLYEKNAHQQYYPASITKIMTALLALENGNMQDQVVFSADSVFKTEGSGIGRDVDEVMTLEQCMYAMMLNSANECAYAIAEHVGKSYDQFIQMMNDRAVALGCKETHFSNPNGLPDEAHYSSCYDMALISSAAIRKEGFRTIAGTRKYVIPPTNKHPDENTYLSNHHKMLQPNTQYTYEGCIGGKTGYTVAAGNTLVTYAQRDGMLLVCVVMNEQTPNHYLDTRALLDYAFANFQIWNALEYEPYIQESGRDRAKFLLEQDYTAFNREDSIILPKTAEFGDARPAAVTEGRSKEAVGALEYTYAGRCVGKVDLLLTDKYLEFFPCPDQKGKEAGQEYAKGGKEDNVPFFPFGLGIALLVLAAGGILTGARYYIKKQEDNK